MVVGFLIGFLTTTTVLFAGMMILFAVEIQRLKNGEDE